jgi:hypothetical protein
MISEITATARPRMRKTSTELSSPPILSLIADADKVVVLLTLELSRLENFVNDSVDGADEVRNDSSLLVEKAVKSDETIIDDNRVGVGRDWSDEVTVINDEGNVEEEEEKGVDDEEDEDCGEDVKDDVI